MRRAMLISLFAVVLLVAACGRSAPDVALAGRVSETMAAGPGAAIDPQALVDFEWDKLWFFAPYTPGDVIEETLGFSWGAAEGATPLQDGEYLLVFVAGDGVVRHARVAGDFSQVVRQEPWRPGDVFVVQERTDQWGLHAFVVPVDAASP